MKKVTKLLIGTAFAAAIAVSFWAGSYTNEQAHIDSRMQRCHTLLSLAIDKVENQDLSDPDIMEALVSNLYAACEVCDNPDLSAQLHQIWNTLIFDSDTYISRKDVLAERLQNISEAL